MILDDVLNEAYLGKSKELKHMEDLIEKIRIKYGTSGSSFHGFRTMFSNLESSEEWQELRKSFEDVFGFYSVSLLLDSNTEFPNAFTVPMSITFDANVRAPFAIQYKDKRIKYDKKHKFCTLIIITAPLLFTKKLSSAEILAVLLHEVGHNFDTAVLPGFLGIRILDIIMQASNAISSKPGLIDLPLVFSFLMGLFTPTRMLDNAITNAIQSNPTLQTLKKMTMGFITLVPHSIGLIKKIIYPVLKLSAIENIITALMYIPVIIAYKVVYASVFSYTAETFADSFATLYGYGPELQSALIKMKTEVMDEGIGTNKALASIPIIGHWMGLNEYVWDHFASLTDGHPNFNARLKTSINLLEKDLQDPRIDKKTKYQVKDDLKKLNKIYDEFNKLSESDKDIFSDSNYAHSTRASMEKLSEYIYGRHMPDIRSGVMDLLYGGASSIHNSIERIKKIRSDT